MKSSLTRFGILVLFCTLLLSLGILFANSAAWGQEASAKIVGTITDPNAGVIAGVKITVTNTATQVSRETATDPQGFFQVLSLPIGTYRISAEHEGFRKATVDSPALQINQVLRVDIQMELGASSETVEVSALVSGVETVNATLGQSVTSRPLVNTPLNGRNVLSLALLQPGVVEVNPDSGAAGTFGIAGGRSDSVTYLLDGGINNNLLSNGVVLNPNPDTIAEFRILTSNYSAEYGRNAGGIVSVVTKSGTNSFHGSAFEFLRNDALNANTFFRNRNGLPREILKRNQFGFTVGGPIEIPKVIHGRDRFFFFVGYQGQRLVQQQSTATINVFTPAELSGDFSLSNATRTGPDPGVACFLSGFFPNGTGCAKDAKGNPIQGTPHPFFQSDSSKALMAIIDPAKINIVSQNYIKQGLIPTSPTGQSIFTGGAQDNNDELTGKFDFTISPKDRLAVTLGSLRNPRLIPFTAESNVPGFPVTTTNHRYFANIAYTRIFSANVLNEFRFTTQRNNSFQSVPARQLPKPNDLGIGIISDNPTGPTQLQFRDKQMTLGFSRGGPTTLIDNTFSFSDTLSWTRGKHAMKFGGTFVPYQDNTVYDFFINGRFRFTSSRFTGNNFADFFIGTPRTYLQFPEAPSNIRTRATYGFAQDEWHLLRNFTVTLGLRYEYSQPKLDTQGRSFSLLLGQQSTRFKNAPLGLVFPGDVQAPVGSNFSDKDDWAPRIGFAWDPKGSGKTSIRGGFGVFYDILKGEDNLQFNGQAPFFGFAGFGFPALRRNPTAPVTYLTDPFGSVGVPNSFPSKPPAPDVNFGAAGFLPVGDGGVYFVDNNLRTPYTYQYNLSIQREVVRDMVFEASYVGSSSHKLTSLVDANPFILKDPAVHRLFNAQPGVANDTYSFLDQFRNVVTASFNSMELSIQKRVSRNRFFGTSFFTLAYTYGHSIDDASGFRERNSIVPYYNPRQFRASSDFDVRHRITFSGGWDLPFDRAWSSGPKRLTNGWSVYPIVTYRTGFPLDVFAGGDFFDDMDAPGPSGAGDGGQVRANLVGNSVVILDPKTSQTFKNRAGNFWFNPANFNVDGLDPLGTAALLNPALSTYGTLPRNFFRAPSRVNFDFAVAKSTQIIGERLGMEFRAEFFNIFNHAEFGSPNTTRTSSQFGQISTTADPRIIQFAIRLTY